MNKFQLVVLATFGFFAALAVMVFTGAVKLPTEDAQLRGTVTVWGTFPSNAMRELLFNSTHGTNISVTYQEHDASTFERDLVEALAAGAGPDLFFITQDTVEKHQNKAYIIPQDVYGARDFRDTFIEEAALFLSPDGIMALPFLVDPLVVYWNRDVFSSAGVPQMPRTWEEFFSIVPRLTAVDERKTITQSAVALGEYENIAHAKDILALLILQTGNTIVEKTNDGKYNTVLNASSGGEARQAQSALTFYTEFANPSSAIYSWNRSLPQSTEMFITEDLAVYLGFASERREILRSNPRLSLGVSSIPTIGGDIRSQATFGRLHGVMISKASQNLPAAFYIATQMTAAPFAENLETAFGLPPVRRDLLAAGTDDAERTVLYESAVRARGWRDPDPALTDPIFRGMIEGVTSGRFQPGTAIIDAVRAFDVILKDLNRNR